MKDLKREDLKNNRTSQITQTQKGKVVIASTYNTLAQRNYKEEMEQKDKDSRKIIPRNRD